MDRQVRDQILQMLEDTSLGIQNSKQAQDETLLAACVTAIEAVAEVCQNELSAARYAHYQEIFDGMTIAFQQSREAHMTADKLNEACDLSIELIQYVEKELKHDPEVKKEIVFLPYKASMWDSLESIWRAAATDTEHCNAYVVPLPYCDRNPDGTAKEWHCEINLFPKDVPVMDWQTVNLQKMHPDVIYIHNPYDQYNAATSVDSAYYSSNLKQYTDMLVYVPYFIVGTRWPEMQLSEPVYANMNRMIVQRENIEIAPSQFSQLKEKDHKYMADFIPKEKMVPLGIPKIDRIFYCAQHKEIPAEWVNRIQNRKVIFYNTSISGILGNGERFLKKMHYIFSCFVNRQDVVLLWRPHPLIESAIKAVGPELYHKYMALKQAYLNQNIGILDTTPDVDMAIAISDAYLGESSSSVVQLFGFAGKPIFLSDEVMLWQRPTLEEKASIQYGTLVAEPDKIWFIAEGYNTFCSMDRRTGNVTPLLKFNDFPVNSGQYSTFIHQENIFYFAPANAKEICIYHLDTNEFQMIPIEQPMEFCNFGAIVPYKEYLFFLPCRYPGILRYNTQTGECTYYRDCLKEILADCTGSHEELLAVALQQGSMLILPAIQTNKILEFDMDTAEYHVFPIGPHDTDCICIVEEAPGSNVFWLIPWKMPKIRRWDRNTGACEVIDQYPLGYACEVDWFNQQDTFMFSGLGKFDDGIWLLPALGNMILRVDIRSKQIEQVDITLPHALDERKSNFYMQQTDFLNGIMDCDGKTMIALSSFDRTMLFIDLEKRECVRQLPCRMNEADAKRLPTPIAEAFGKIGKDVPYAVNESVVCRNVDQYIDYVLSEKHNSQVQQEAYQAVANNADGTCGQKVHQYIMEQIS